MRAFTYTHYNTPEHKRALIKLSQIIGRGGEKKNSVPLIGHVSASLDLESQVRALFFPRCQHNADVVGEARTAATGPPRPRLAQTSETRRPRRCKSPGTEDTSHLLSAIPAILLLNGTKNAEVPPSQKSVRVRGSYQWTSVSARLRVYYIRSC